MKKMISYVSAARRSSRVGSFCSKARRVVRAIFKALAACAALAIVGFVAWCFVAGLMQIIYSVIPFFQPNVPWA